jgi:Cu/Ag efflux protein CusF
MKTYSRRPTFKSLAAIALLSATTGLSVTAAFPRTEGLQHQLITLGMNWTATYFEMITTSTAAMAQSLVEGQGKVIAVTPEKQQVVLEHGEIKGFMDAMTMGYKVSSISLLKGLKPGDEVSFSIDPKKSTIVKIGKLAK